MKKTELKKIIREEVDKLLEASDEMKLEKLSDQRDALEYQLLPILKKLSSKDGKEAYKMAAEALDKLEFAIETAAVDMGFSI